MAKVVATQTTSDQRGTFQLQSVGIGVATLIQQGLQVVDIASAPKLGLELDYAAKQWLTESERQLDLAQLIALTPTVAIFDVPSIVLRDAKHHEVMVRHFLWLDTTTGRITFLVWYLENGEQAKPLQVVDGQLRLVIAPCYTDRHLHVDGREFFLGLPTKMAFATEDLLPGKDIPWSSPLKSLANLKSFDERSLTDLAKEFNSALQPLR